jgi:hypothetical protein
MLKAGKSLIYPIRSRSNDSCARELALVGGGPIGDATPSGIEPGREVGLRIITRGRLSRPNVKDETRAGERADDLNLGKMRSGVGPCELRPNSRALSLSAG